MSGIKIIDHIGNGKLGSGLSTFKCSRCGKAVPISVYAEAQMCLGETLIHTHDCGARHELAPGRRVRAVGSSNAEAGQ